VQIERPFPDLRAHPVAPPTLTRNPRRLPAWPTTRPAHPYQIPENHRQLGGPPRRLGPQLASPCAGGEIALLPPPSRSPPPSYPPSPAPLNPLLSPSIPPHFFPPFSPLITSPYVRLFFWSPAPPSSEESSPRTCRRDPRCAPRHGRPQQALDRGQGAPRAQEVATALGYRQAHLGRAGHLRYV
jgi:hypothetical protein